MGSKAPYRPTGCGWDLGNITDETLLALHTDVATDGSSASFTVHVSNRTPFCCEIDFADMPGVFAKVAQAMRLMLARQRSMPGDNGAASMQEIVEGALQPIESIPMIDWQTGDRIFVHQFHDHPPIAIRLSTEDTAAIREQLRQALVLRSH